VPCTMWASCSVPRRGWRGGRANLYFIHRVTAALSCIGRQGAASAGFGGIRAAGTTRRARCGRADRAGRAGGGDHSRLRGYRTLDSIVRAEKIFGLRRFTIISQATTTAAVFLARKRGLDVVAYNARGLGSATPASMVLREIGAR